MKTQYCFRGEGGRVRCRQSDLEPERLRWTLAAMPLQRSSDGQITLAVGQQLAAPRCGDRPGWAVLPCLRARQDQFIPGSLYSFIAVLESGPASRPDPGDGVGSVSRRSRAADTEPVGAGHWSAGQAPVTVVADAGYDIAHLAHLAADLPVLMVRAGAERPGPPLRGEATPDRR